MSHLGRTCICLQSPHPSTSGRFCRKVYMNDHWHYHRNQAGTLSRNPRRCKSKGNHSFYTKMPSHCRSCTSIRTFRIFCLFQWKSQRHKKMYIWETYLDQCTWPRHLLCVCSCELQFHLKERKYCLSSLSSSLLSSLSSLHQNLNNEQPGFRRQEKLNCTYVKRLQEKKYSQATFPTGNGNECSGKWFYNIPKAIILWYQIVKSENTNHFVFPSF